MKKLILVIKALVFTFIFCSQVVADKLSDANKLFDWAEISYPEYFTPAGSQTLIIDGYFARYYSMSKNYLGTKADRVYVLGNDFGGLLDVGDINVYLDTIDKAETEGETAVQGLNEILELYQSRNFETLVRERYAELYKANTEEDINRLIVSFDRRFSDSEALEEVTDYFILLLKGSPEISTDYVPQISETGEIAIFKEGETSFILYRMKTGLWGFHL